MRARGQARRRRARSRRSRSSPARKRDPLDRRAARAASRCRGGSRCWCRARARAAPQHGSAARPSSRRHGAAPIAHQQRVDPVARAEPREQVDRGAFGRGEQAARRASLAAIRPPLRPPAPSGATPMSRYSRAVAALERSPTPRRQAARTSGASNAARRAQQAPASPPRATSVGDSGSSARSTTRRNAPAPRRRKRREAARRRHRHRRRRPAIMSRHDTRLARHRVRGHPSWFRRVRWSKQGDDAFQVVAIARLHFATRAATLASCHARSTALSGPSSAPPTPARPTWRSSGCAPIRRA